MRSLIFTIVMLFLSLTLSSQTYEMKTDNFRQLDETAIQWELWIKKTSGSDFGLYTWQLQWTWNGNILNGGEFTGANFTISPGTDAVFMGHYNDADAVVPGPGQYFSHTPSSFPNTGQLMTLVTEDWKHIATFTARLSLSGNLHNFASADPQFAHRLGGIVEVFAANNPYAGPGTQTQISGTLTSAPGEAINERQLAGYYFSGTNDYNVATNWNQVLKTATPAYTQVVPAATDNAVIAGSSTVTDFRQVNQLTVAEGAYLVLNPTAQLTSNMLYNDNLGGGGNGEVDIAGWDFEINTNFTADNGNGLNQNISFISWHGTINTVSIIGGKGYNESKGLVGRGFIYYPAENEYSWWQFNPNTSGYQNLSLSVKVTGNGGLEYYKTQWSLDGSTWNDVPGGLLNMSPGTGTYANPLWFVFDNISLPQDLENQPNVLIRFLAFHPTNEEFEITGLASRNMIDDIVITGEPLPSGILVQSTAAGTGSLIHNNTGVLATVQRTLPGSSLAWHTISAPVNGMLITGSGFQPGASDDFYLWHEPSPGTWVNYKNQDGGGGTPSFPVANGGNNFAPGRGYLVAYNEANPTKTFTGELNAGNVSIALSKSGAKWDYTPGWNLIGNPYASSLNFGALTTAGILAENYAQVYDPTAGGGGGYVQVTTIAPHQGFFVVAANNAVSLALNTTHQVHGGTFLKNEGVTAEDMFALKLSNDQYFDITRIFLNTQASSEYDFYDASKLLSFNTSMPQIYSLVNGQHQLAINSVPSISESLTIPVSILVPSNGIMTISLTDIAGAFEDQTIVLYDKITNTYHNLSDMPVYNFTASTEDSPDRFEIAFTTVGIPETSVNSLVNAYAFANMLYVMNYSDKATVQLYGLQGQLILNQEIGQGLSSLPIAVPKGSYIVKMISAGETATRKVVIN